MASGVVETLFVCRQVNIFKIPPRAGGGHKSGTWLTEDKIFSGRLRVISQGTLCTIILEDDSGKEFAQCPIPQGEKDQAVESVTDSSRYFVIRLMTPGDARQKAFVGLGFDDRAEAFDFQVALTDHEKHLRRAKDTALAAQSMSQDGTSAPAQLSSDAANLYQSRDLSLKDGETLKINFRKGSRESLSDSKLKFGQGSGLQLPQAGLKLPAPRSQSTQHKSAPVKQDLPQMQVDGAYLTDLLGMQPEQKPHSSNTVGSEEWTAF